jgi:predicted RNA-binding Zn ribbon-like protein
MVGREDPFDWSGGDPALDFVNTLDERTSVTPAENLSTYENLVRFVALAGLVERGVLDRLQLLRGPNCSRIAKRARELREHLHAILAADHVGKGAPEASLAAISSEVRRAHSAQLLVARAAPDGFKHGWASPNSPELPLHACALAIERFLITADHSRIRKCGASDCDVYFIDTSKARRRQWCSMRNCGNREKQRRWRSGLD